MLWSLAGDGVSRSRSREAGQSTEKLALGPHEKGRGGDVAEAEARFVCVGSVPPSRPGAFALVPVVAAEARWQKGQSPLSWWASATGEDAQLHWLDRLGETWYTSALDRESESCL